MPRWLCATPQSKGVAQAPGTQSLPTAGVVQVALETEHSGVGQATVVQDLVNGLPVDTRRLQRPNLDADRDPPRRSHSEHHMNKCSPAFSPPRMT